MISRTAFNPTNPTASSPRNSPSLATTISNLNDEVGDFEDSVFQGYIRETSTATQQSSNSFSFSGDLTEWYTAGRRIRFNEASTAVYCTVLSSSHNAGTTTVTTQESTVPATITTLDLAIQEQGNTNPTQYGTTLVKPIVQGSVQTEVDHVAAASVTLDMSEGGVHNVDCSIETTLTLDNISVGQTFMVNVTVTSGVDIIWFSGIQWPDEVEPPLSTTTGKVDAFGFYCYGTNKYRGFVLGQGYAE